VAAASSCKKQVIGIDGGLPWSIPKDRELFKSLTREKILIIGRRTLEECPSLVHVKHTSHCIIVSKSMRNLDDYKTKHVNCELKIVRSFPEALHCARNLATETSKDNNNSLQCWVGGGQSLFEKALRHPSAAEIHLSWVQLEMDISSNNEYARFPAKYRWDHKFKPFSEKLYPGNPKTPSFVYSIYKLQKQMDS
jgi:dihydrofolate reductase